MIPMIPSRVPRALTLVGAMVLGACASSPPSDPTELEMARSAIEEAKQLGSEQHAHQVLRDAEERLKLARARAEDGAPEEASPMLVEARAPYRKRLTRAVHDHVDSAKRAPGSGKTWMRGAGR